MNEVIKPPEEKWNEKKMYEIAMELSTIAPYMNDLNNAFSQNLAKLTENFKSDNQQDWYKLTCIVSNRANQ